MIYLWQCDGCGVQLELSRPMAECSVPPDTEVKCCDSVKWRRVYEMPMQMKASYPDGLKRKGWTELKEAAKLEKERAVARTDAQKNEIAREITKMGVKPGSST